MKKLIKNFLVFFLIFIIIIGIFSVFGESKTKIEVVGIKTFIEQVNNEEISEVVVEGDMLKVKLKNGEEEKIKKEIGETLSELLNNFGVEKDKIAILKIEVKDESGLEFWLKSILPFLFPFLLIGFFLYFMIKGVQGANSKAMMFGRSQAKEIKDQKQKITFKNVAGSKEAKEELKEVIEFLRFPKKFHELGARIPHGVLLLGSPGTGKTLMARAVAGEAQVPFYHISGSEFVEMFVGVGASRVRDLFKRAKNNAPCIIFIDEIDAVGRKRGAGLGGSHDEREQTLNQILVEMDGFESNANVIVIAATNRPDVLDNALLRPGRFDRRIIIDLPDIKGREEILKVHSRKKSLSKEVNLRNIAERTPGFSGADLANVLNEAAILSVRGKKKIISMEELFEAIEKVMMGPERKSRIISKKEKKITAFHEAGHAIVANFLPNTDPVHKVSIIARGQAGGYTLKLPHEDRHMHAKSEFTEELAVFLAGFVVEKEYFGEVTTGATSDLRRATNLARSLITDYGMSEVLGPRTFGNKEEMIFLGREIHEQRDYSEKAAEQIDQEITDFIGKAVVCAKNIIRDKKQLLEKVVEVLLKEETIEKDRFDKIMKGE